MDESLPRLSTGTGDQPHDLLPDGSLGDVWQWAGRSLVHHKLEDTVAAVTALRGRQGIGETRPIAGARAYMATDVQHPDPDVEAHLTLLFEPWDYSSGWTWAYAFRRPGSPPNTPEQLEIVRTLIRETGAAINTQMVRSKSGVQLPGEG